MNSILVATDFSAPSKAAANYAAELAKITGAELTLLHAYLLPTPVSEVPYVMVSVDELQQDSERLTREMADHLSQTFGIGVKTLVTIGMPADEVVFQAEEMNAGLIVVGMRGVSDALDRLIGSTTAAVLRKSKIPVLVIPENSPFTPWKHVAYATDYNATMDLHCLELLHQLARAQSDMHLHIVHVHNTGDLLSADQIAGKMRLEPVLKQISHSFHTEENNSTEDGIKNFLHTQNCDALVMVAHKHSWWDRLFNGSLTRDMVYQTEIPMLVLQDK